jgi:hypothetical protein
MSGDKRGSVMALTADDLVDVLIACSGGEIDGLAADRESAGLAEIVLLLRHAQPMFAATVLSAWQACGSELSPALLLELEMARTRVDYYRSVDASLTSKVPDLISVNGLEIADLYPSGLLRNMTDLDYVAEVESDLWQACEQLIRDGWELETATFCYFRGSPQIMVSLTRQHEDPYQLPYGVEVATYFAAGNYGAIRPLMHLRAQWRAPAVKNILMLLYERYEQPYRARDLVDAALLFGSLRDDELAALHDAVRTLSLGVEYCELIELTGRAGLGPLPAWPGRRWATNTLRARRLAQGASYFLRPLAGSARQLQRRMMTGDLGHTEEIAWDAVQRRLAVPQAISGGLLAFGLPLDCPAPQVTSTVLSRRGKLAWADTPIARFLLTIGDFVSQDDVDELTGQAATASPSARLSDDCRRIPGRRPMNVTVNSRT